jgi:hypothetical protein
VPLSVPIPPCPPQPPVILPTDKVFKWDALLSIHPTIYHHTPCLRFLLAKVLWFGRVGPFLRRRTDESLLTNGWYTPEATYVFAKVPRSSIVWCCSTPKVKMPRSKSSTRLTGCYRAESRVFLALLSGGKKVHGHEAVHINRSLLLEILLVRLYCIPM